jgi:hypothetical protein
MRDLTATEPQPTDALRYVSGARDLGDLTSRVIDGLSLQFERHATSVVQAKSRNTTQIFCGEGVA